MRKAQNLDPLSLIINADLAELLLIAHTIAESEQQSIKTIEMDARFPLAHNQLALAYLERGKYDDAITELRKAVQLSAGGATFTANLARAFAVSGRKSDAARLLDDLERRSRTGFSSAPEIAVVYAALGDHERAMTWLEKGFAERFNPGVLLRPGLDSLRSDGRFRDLERRVGLVR